MALLLVAASPGQAQENRSIRQSAASLYRRAEAKLEQKRYDEARDLIVRALEQEPDSGVFVSGVLTEPYYPHYLLGLIHMELEEFDTAVREFLLEEQQGQIQHDAALHETLTLQLAKARQTDNQAPVIKEAAAEILETDLVGQREVAQVRFHGVVVDVGGVGSLTIHGREVGFRQSADGFLFDETLLLDPVVPEVQLAVADVTGNSSEQRITLELPPLDLGLAARDVRAVLVGVDRYGRPAGGPGGGCPPAANTCADPSKFVCYNLPDLGAAAQDARRFHDFLLKRGVPRENLRLLVSDAERKEADLAHVAAALDELQRASGGKAIFYFAGHGVNSRRHKNLMLLSDTSAWECEDAPPEAATPLEASALGVDAVERALARASFDERYVILDACRSPRAASTRSPEVGRTAVGFSARGAVVVPDAAPEGTVGLAPVVFYATFDNSVSVEWNQRQAGYFTWYLLQGLRRDLSLWELKSFVQDHVQRRTSADHGLTQKPHVVLPEALENDYDLQRRTYLLGPPRAGD